MTDRRHPCRRVASILLALFSEAITGRMPVNRTQDACAPYFPLYASFNPDVA
jgi:hypothetical protein